MSPPSHMCEGFVNIELVEVSLPKTLLIGGWRVEWAGSLMRMKHIIFVFKKQLELVCEHTSHLPEN